jgi:hypothetical protein
MLGIIPRYFIFLAEQLSFKVARQFPLQSQKNKDPPIEIIETPPMRCRLEVPNHSLGES